MFFGKRPQGNVIGSPEELDKRALHPIFDLRWGRLTPSLQAAFINIIVSYAKRFVTFSPTAYAGNYLKYTPVETPASSVSPKLIQPLSPAPSTTAGYPAIEVPTQSVMTTLG